MKIGIAVFLLLFISCSKPKEAAKIVGIQPYERFSKEKATDLAKTISEYYHLKTIVLPEKKLPKSAFINIKSPRYRADSIIIIQKKSDFKNCDYILGLTDNDISITKKEADGSIKKPEWKYNDFGVMGLAYRPGNSAIISSFRLKNKEQKLFSERLKKVVIHEFGHNLGLPHCKNKHCVMTSACEKISTIDNEKMSLCETCASKIKS